MDRQGVKVLPVCVLKDMKIENSLAGSRVDFALSHHPSTKDLGTRARKRLCDNGQVFVNGKIAKAQYKLLLGQDLEVRQGESILSATAFDIQDIVLKEDNDFIAVYKAHGIASAKIIASNSESIEEIICRDFPEYILLNRLDFETSGILIFAKHDKALDTWKIAQENGEIEKRYYALVVGNYEENICIDSIISTKRNKVRSIEKLEEDETRYTWASPLDDNKKDIFKEILVENTSIVDCMIKRGVRHQIRCHLASLDFPLLGDNLYSCILQNDSDIIEENTKIENTFFLHHYSLESSFFNVQCEVERRFKE